MKSAPNMTPQLQREIEELINANRDLALWNLPPDFMPRTPEAAHRVLERIAARGSRQSRNVDSRAPTVARIEGGKHERVGTQISASAVCKFEPMDAEICIPTTKQRNIEYSKGDK